MKSKKNKEQIKQIESFVGVLEEGKDQFKSECVSLVEFKEAPNTAEKPFEESILKKKIKLRTALILVLVTVLLIEGPHLIYRFTNRDFYAFIDELNTINKLIDKKYIYKDYIDKADKDYMYSNACKSFVNSLGDEHTGLLSRKELSSFELGINEIFGTGCSIKMLEFEDRPGEYYFQIADVEANSPLEKAGFLPGDEILRVNKFISSAYYNNENTDDIVPVKTDKEHAGYFLAGIGDFTLVDENTETTILCNSNLENMYGLLDMFSPQQKRDVLARSVYIEAWRFNPETEQYEVYSATVQKDKLPSKSVSYKVFKEQNIGYLRLSTFKFGSSSQEFTEALEALLSAKIGGIVLDLRGNHGGSLDEYNKIITQLIKEGPLYYCEGSDSQECVSATGKNFKTDINIAVLVNKESASASEMLAANMQTHKRGVVIGERTYGKGVGQSVFALKNGDCLFLVDKFWCAMPGQLNINKVGVEPDICVESTNLNDENFAVYGYDTPLTTAVDYLVKDVEPNEEPEAGLAE